MRDYDAENRFYELSHYVMQKCGYRRDVGGVGICSLNVAPCERVFLRGECEAVAEWIQNHREVGEDE